MTKLHYGARSGYTGVKTETDYQGETEMTEAAADPRVVAVRADSKVGVGTCTFVSECFTDDELVAFLDDFEATTPAKAVREMRAHESLMRDLAGTIESA